MWHRVMVGNAKIGSLLVHLSSQTHFPVHGYLRESFTYGVTTFSAGLSCPPRATWVFHTPLFHTIVLSSAMSIISTQLLDPNAFSFWSYGCSLGLPLHPLFAMFVTFFLLSINLWSSLDFFSMF